MRSSLVFETQLLSALLGFLVFHNECMQQWQCARWSKYGMSDKKSLIFCGSRVVVGAAIPSQDDDYFHRADALRVAAALEAASSTFVLGCG